MKSVLNDELIDFLNKSHNEYFAANEIKNILLKNGFKELKENERWSLKQNSSYFFLRNLNSLVAFKTPIHLNKATYSNKIISSHLDSPALKLKENPANLTYFYEKWKVEVYGGLINSTYVDRPLGVAGRIVTRENNIIRTKLVDSNKAIAIIPNVAIHQNRNINNGFVYNPQIDLLPIVGIHEDENTYFDKFIESFLNKNEELLSYDLYLYNFDKAQYVGVNDDLICGAKEDDLSAAFLSLKSLIYSKNNENSFTISAFFNNEETGSLSFSGADSDLLSATLRRIESAFNINKEESLSARKRSFALSADNGHAIHPNHPELSDDKNICKLNKGILIKFNSNMAYTSDAFSSSLVKVLCKDENIPYQVFFNRSDARGGSTLGNISISKESILTCDIGLPQLAMHSTYETIGSDDTKHMFDLMKTFYEREFVINNDQINFLEKSNKNPKIL